MFDFHHKYKKISPWWRFIRQEFRLLIVHSEFIDIYGKEYEDHFLSLSKNGQLNIKRDFLFGASGPTIDTESSRRASLVHDAIYHLSDNGVFKGCCSDDMRTLADKLLYKICLEEGMWKFRAKAWLIVLNMFGDLAWESGK